MMYSYLLNRLVATVIVYGLLLQGCRSGFRINSEDFSLEKSRQIDNDGQITHPDVQSSVLSGVPHSKLPTVASAILPSMTASTDQVASLMHHLAVGPDTVSSWGPSSSTESEEIDTKPAAQVAGCSSVGYSASLCASLFSVPASVFGVQEWRRYLGEVGEAPCLPSAIDEILHSACPFWPGKLVKDTHLLILIPSTVDGKAFTLDLLGELIQNPRGDGHRTQYFLYDDEVQMSSGDVYSSSSYWVLLMRDVLPGSRNEPYEVQQALVAAQSSRVDDPPYAIPNVLEAATVILSHYVRSGEERQRLYSDNPWTYTRCRDLVAWCGNNYSALVGCFSSGGLYVDYRNYPDVSNYRGVAGLRKF